MTLTRDTYGWVPLPSASPHPEAWLGVGGLIGPSWRAPTALRGLRGALGRWGTSEGRTGLKNAFFGPVLVPRPVRSPRTPQKDSESSHLPAKGTPFGRCEAGAVRVVSGPGRAQIPCIQVLRPLLVRASA